MARKKATRDTLFELAEQEGLSRLLLELVSVAVNGVLPFGDDTVEMATQLRDAIREEIRFRTVRDAMRSITGK